MLTGKKGIVMGVANSRSIATGIATTLHREGAELGFSYLPDPDGGDKMQRRVDKAISHLQPRFVIPCNVAEDTSITTFFQEVRTNWDKIDFLVHAIAFAPLPDIRCATVQASRAGFLEAMNISVYSLLAVVRTSMDLMLEGGAIATMTYYGGEKVIAGYNMMGICKAALDCTVRYLANDLGDRGIRINSVSPGPLKTLASSAIAGFTKMQKLNTEITPLKRTLTTGDVGDVTAFLLSDHAVSITGELLHVDNGSHILGSNPLS